MRRLILSNTPTQLVARLINYIRQRRQLLHEREAALDQAANPLDLQTDISDTDALRILLRATSYVRYYIGRFTVRFIMNGVSLAIPIVLLPWSFKIVIDHVVLKRPIDEAEGFPGYFDWLISALQGKDPLEIMIFLVVFFAVAVLLVGAYAPGGATRDTVDANMVSGHDTATQTENAVHGGISLASGIWGYVEYRMNSRLTQAINHHVRSKLFRHIKAMPITTLEDQRIGDAVYRVMYDTPSITMCFYEVIMSPVLTLWMFLLAMWIFIGVYIDDAPEVVWLAASFLPLQFLISLFFTRMARRRNQASRAAGTITTSTIEEGMDNILAVQSLGGNEKERERFGTDSMQSFRRYRNTVWVNIVFDNLAGFFGRFLFFAMFFFACIQVIHDRLSPGDYGVLWFYFYWMRGPVVAFSTLWLRFQASLVGMRRVFRTLDMPIEEDEGTQPLTTINDGVKISNAGLVYPDGRRALQEVSVEGKIGEILAFVGPTGSGKTSLAYLIPRFHKTTEGHVEIDGVNVNDINLDDLRSQVTYVFQETQLFSRSIFENIIYAKPDATLDEVMHVSIIAGADEFIAKLPEGYETILGTTNAKLSVGQKQRIAIARGLIRDSKILILDEPTSALDPETEEYLVRSLEEAAKDRLVIIIAHRLSTIAKADKIVFLDQGRVLEQGSHAELLRNPDGHYRRYVDLQTTA